MKRLAFVLFIVLLPRIALAQSQQCELKDSRQLYSTGEGAIIYVGGPIFTCENGSRITADSAIIVQETGRAEFMGKVRFTDATRSLNAEFAQYLPRERRIMAQVNVLVTNLRDGSTLRANALDYYQPSPTYPDGRVDVHRGGRPRGTLIRRRANSAAIDTTIIDADEMQLIGERIFRGRGQVQTRRGTMTSTSQFAEFDEQTNRMRLTGQAVVQSDTMKLRADSIEAVLIDGDEFKELHAHRNVMLESDEMNLNAPAVHINFAEGAVERMVAIGGTRAGADAPQARAVSPDFVLTADSIDAVSPKQKLQTVFAVGKAHGERIDTLAKNDLPQLIRNDWVRGDTIRAWFTERAPAPAAKPTSATIRPATPRAQTQRPAAGQRVAGDSTRVLERILATGSPASSTYRLREQSGDSVAVSVNYITAKMLDVTFKEGEVTKVEAQGDIRGLYLQPPPRAQASAPAPGRRQ